MVLSREFVNETGERVIERFLHIILLTITTRKQNILIFLESRLISIKSWMEVLVVNKFDIP